MGKKERKSNQTNLIDLRYRREARNRSVEKSLDTILILSAFAFITWCLTYGLTYLAEWVAK